MVWYSHLFQNFPQFIVIHTVKGFGIVNKAEMFFWNSLAFSMIRQMLTIWSLVPLPFLKPAWTSGSSRFPYCWRLAWRILSITLLACEMRLVTVCVMPFWLPAYHTLVDIFLWLHYRKVLGYFLMYESLTAAKKTSWLWNLSIFLNLNNIIFNMLILYFIISKYQKNLSK